MTHQQRWRVPYRRRRHRWCSALKQGFDAILVKVTRDENLYVVPPHAVEPMASPKAIGKDIAAVETDAAGLLVQRNDFVDGRADVVGVYQKSDCSGKTPRKVRKASASSREP